MWTLGWSASTGIIADSTCRLFYTWFFINWYFLCFSYLSPKGRGGSRLQSDQLISGLRPSQLILFSHSGNASPQLILGDPMLRSTAPLNPWQWAHWWKVPRVSKLGLGFHCLEDVQVQNTLLDNCVQHNKWARAFWSLYLEAVRLQL
jgi:hypothetical protein